MSERVPHNRQELERLLSLACGRGSVLEIGSRFGFTLKKFARVMKKGGRVVSVDLPNGPWGAVNSQVELEQNIEEIKRWGFDAHLFLGDSKDKEIIKKVKALGPFDLVFIDGDHNYEGAKADWENYGPLGKVVVFHDVLRPESYAKQSLQVWRLWEEIEGKKERFVGAHSTMGIGIWRKS